MWMARPCKKSGARHGEAQPTKHRPAEPTFLVVRFATDAHLHLGPEPRDVCAEPNSYESAELCRRRQTQTPAQTKRVLFLAVTSARHANHPSLAHDLGRGFQRQPSAGWAQVGNETERAGSRVD